MRGSVRVSLHAFACLSANKEMLTKPWRGLAAVLKQGRELSSIRQLSADLYAKLYVGARFRALLNVGANRATLQID